MHLDYIWDMFINNFFTKLYIPTLYSFQKERFNARSQCFPFGGEVKMQLKSETRTQKYRAACGECGVVNPYIVHTLLLHASAGKI